MKSMDLKIGDVVQLSPDVGNKAFACCFMTVTDPKSFGAQGYVQPLGEKSGEPAKGQAYYRAKWEEMEYVGKSVWIAQ